MIEENEILVLNAPLQTIRAFLHSMEQRNEGQIVAVSSIAGFCGETNGIAYWLVIMYFEAFKKCVECTNYSIPEKSTPVFKYCIEH